MSAARPAQVAPDSPEVAAFRKKARGEPLTDAERELLANATRKPDPAARTVPHERIEAMLEERRRREVG
jgi:hypothetical protein